MKRRNGGEKELGRIWLGWVVTRWPAQGSELGLESHSSTAIPIVNWKRNPSKLCYCLVLCAAYDFSSSPRSRWVRPLYSLFESQATGSTKSSEQKKKKKKTKAEGILSRHVSGVQHTACRGKTLREAPRQKKWKSIDFKSVQRCAHCAVEMKSTCTLCRCLTEPLVIAMDCCRILHM